MKKLFLIFLFLSSITLSQTYIEWSADIDEEGIVTVNCDLSGDLLMYFNAEVNGFDDLDSDSDYNYSSERSLELEVSVDKYRNYSIINCELIDQDTYETISDYSFKANKKYYLSD